MNGTLHERPGVYSSYDASSVISRGSAEKVIGVAACAVKGTAGQAVTLHSYSEGLAAFGADEAGKPGMAAMLRLLFLGGAGTVVAAAADQSGDSPDYTAAFAALALEEDVAVVVCDSAETTVQQALRESVESCAANRRERIAVVGAENESVQQLITRAAALNSERMVLVGPDALDESGGELPGRIAAAAVAAAIAVNRDSAVPLNGAVLKGLTGVGQQFEETEVDALVRGGVTPLESVSGEVSPIRAVTTRTTTDGIEDSTWRELTTILIVDDVIPEIRDTLRRRFARAKNTAQTRGAVRSETIVQLERKLTAEVIDGYGDVLVYMDEEDPTACVVEFSFTVAHGLNRIYLTAHITV
ncbi:MAG: phage tail sheath subtilisin-like domain-containing protein [Oscillospiraceae bacterium]